MCIRDSRHDVLTGWAMQNAGHPVTADYLESCRFRPHDKVDEALWDGTLDWYQDWIHATRRTDAYWQQGWWKLLADVPGKTKVPVYIIDAWSVSYTHLDVYKRQNQNCILPLSALLEEHPGLKALFSEIGRAHV